MTGAAPGYTIKQSLSQLEDVGWSLSHFAHRWESSDNDIVSNESGRSDRGYEDESWLMRHSALWRWMALRLKITGDPFEAVGWMEDRHLEEGWRRVSLSDYGKSLDRLFVEAARRGVGVVVLSPCNAPMASGERLDGGFPWDVYFKTLSMAAARRQIPVAKGCDILQHADLSPSTAFLDRMHPTAALNQAYAVELADLLVGAGWPNHPMIPNLQPAMFQSPTVDDWPSLIPNPQAKTDGPDVKGPPPHELSNSKK